MTRRFRPLSIVWLLLCSVAAGSGCGKATNTVGGDSGDGDDVKAGDGDGDVAGDGDDPGDGDSLSTGGTPGGTGGDGGDHPTGGVGMGGAAPSGDGGGDGDATGGRNGTGGAAMKVDGPCDIYEAAGSPCAAAYSTIRSLRKDYEGPLFQVRVGSSPYNIGGERVTNPEVEWDPNGPVQITVPEVGELVDVMQAADGFADVREVEARCQSPTVCTISLLYDHSGNGTHLPVAYKASSYGYTEYANFPNFETELKSEALVSVGGRNLYSLYTEPREAYRHYDPGVNMPVGDDPMEIYMLTDGTHIGSECCFQFGNSPFYIESFSIGRSLYFGDNEFGRGATPPGAPWFGLSVEDHIFMGGSEPGDPGWGTFFSTEEERPPNQNNPSMQGAQFALGIYKEKGVETEYALRMANVSSATELHTAYSGELYPYLQQGLPGGVLLGSGEKNQNASYGTFYEGAIIAGYPDEATELDVLRNIQAVGYGQ